MNRITEPSAQVQGETPAPMPQSAGVTDERLADLSLQFVGVEPLSDFDYVGFARAVLALAPGLAPYQPQPEPTSKGEPVSEEIAAMLGERVAFLRDPAVYRGKYWDSMTNEQRKQAFTKLDGGAAGYAKKFWTWRHFDMAAEDIGMASQQREPQEAAETPLRTALRLHHEWSIRNMPGYSEHGEERVAYRVTLAALSASPVLEGGRPESSIHAGSGPIIESKVAASGKAELKAAYTQGYNDAATEFAPKEAGKVEAVSDERQPSDGDYLRWAEQAGAKVNWDFESASSARVVFLTASQWGRFCDKVRALYLRPSQQALGDERIRAIAYECGMFDSTEYEDSPGEHCDRFARAILAASSGSKGGGG